MEMATEAVSERGVMSLKSIFIFTITAIPRKAERPFLG
jgi:hypothetical protein